jgi:hypothetical protein
MGEGGGLGALLLPLLLLTEGVKVLLPCAEALTVSCRELWLLLVVLLSLSSHAALNSGISTGTQKPCTHDMGCPSRRNAWN